ncbi:MAG: hypothetical protein JST10_07415 [Bacteroidetes bacterium]|nr:hypothetical protein [Bacteroidota bacterium]
MFSITEKAKQLINGETSSGKDSKGEAQVFEVAHLQNLFKATIRYNNWLNGERDIVCLDGSNDPRLNTVIGRMRLSVYDFDEGSDWISLKTAVLKNQQPPHATLHQCSYDYYRDFLRIDLEKEIGYFGRFQLGTKEELLNEDGRNRNDLCVLFEKNNTLLPVAAFTLSRIASILL